MGGNTFKNADYPNVMLNNGAAQRRKSAYYSRNGIDPKEVYACGKMNEAEELMQFPARIPMRKYVVLYRRYATWCKKANVEEDKYKKSLYDNAMRVFNMKGGKW